MPNWCNNSISITGKKDNLNKIANKLNDMDNEDTIMSSLIGEPPHDTIPSISGSKNSTYYGTKWDFTKADAEIDIQDETISMFPQTAWTPPIPFLVKLCEEYQVCVHVEYSEPGNDFAGIADIVESGAIESIEMSYLEYVYYYEDEDNFWDGIEQTLSEWEKDYILSWDKFSKKYNFISAEDKIKLREIYNERVRELT